jgi:hypothetical protein
MFNQPASMGSYFKPSDHNGHLILITKVKSSQRRFDEMRKAEIDEFIVDLVDLDGDQILHEDVKVSHVGITNRLRIGSANILGRIGSVNTGKGHPAWVLNSFTDTDVPKAQLWVTQKQFAQPQQPPVVAQTAQLDPNAAAIALLQQQLGAKPAF